MCYRNKLATTTLRHATLSLVTTGRRLVLLVNGKPFADMTKAQGRRFWSRCNTEEDRLGAFIRATVPPPLRNHANHR